MIPRDAQHYTLNAGDLRCPVTIGILEDTPIADITNTEWFPVSFTISGMTITPTDVVFSGVPDNYTAVFTIESSGHATSGDVVLKALTHTSPYPGTGDYIQTGGESITITSDGVHTYTAHWIGYGGGTVLGVYFTLAHDFGGGAVHVADSGSTVVPGTVTIEIDVPETGDYSIRSFLAYDADSGTLLTVDYDFAGTATFTTPRISPDDTNSTVIQWLIMSVTAIGRIVLTLGKSGSGDISVLAGTQFTIHMLGDVIGETE